MGACVLRGVLFASSFAVGGRDHQLGRRIARARIADNRVVTRCRWDVKLAIVVSSVFIAASLVVGSAEATQAASSEQVAGHLSAGVVSANPGATVDVPLMLSIAEQSEMGTVVVAHVSFPKKLLSYVGVKSALAAELAEGQVRAVEEKDEQDSSLSVLKITVEGKRPVRSGLLAYVSFRVSGDVKGSTTIPLKLKDSQVTMTDGARLVLSRGEDGMITILDPDGMPVMACFLYMH
jgi:hypothetical protein